jgi:hypothetical protein
MHLIYPALFILAFPGTEYALIPIGNPHQRRPAFAHPNDCKNHPILPSIL